MKKNKSVIIPIPGVDYRTCNKCGARLELSKENFEPVKPTACNRGFRWHCRECQKELMVL